MVIKEAFQYQNFLDLLSDSLRAAINIGNAFTVQRNHLKSKSNAEAVDEVETDKKSLDVSFDTLVEFTEVLVREKETLTAAINKAKASLDFDIDACVASNKLRQSFANKMKTILGEKPVARQERGTDYKFNVEGNQSSYFYPIEVNYVCDFDKDKCSETAKKYLAEASDISLKIESALVTTPLDFCPMFDVHDSFEDIIKAFEEKKAG